MAGDTEDRRADRSPAAAQIDRAARLRQEMARLAGELAETEDRIAAVRREMASHDPNRAAEHLAVAEEAERWAAHERREQIRWRSAG